MKKLIIIDGNAVMHRAFHAIPKLTSGKMPTNAVYGLVSMLIGIVKSVEPTHIAVCFDRPEPTFRKKIYKKYQSQRPEMDEELSPQFELAKRVLAAINITVFEKVGYEADDLIGTMSVRAKGKGIDEVIIITGDKDILQLVDDKKKIRVYMPKKGMSQYEMLDEDGVVGKIGVKADQIVDYKALMGDSSDNYPGIRGIGPVGAEKLIKKYETYSNIFKNMDKLPDRERKLLLNEKDNGDISYELAKIIKDVDMEIDYTKLNDWNFHTDKVKDIFMSLGFRSLLSRVMKKEEEKRERQMSLL